MSERLRLPSPPPTLRHLSNSQVEMLNKIYTTNRTGYCPTCGDDNVFTWYADPPSRDLGNLAEYECPCNDQYLLHRRFLWSGILERYQRLDWFDLDESVLAAERVLDYVEHADARVSAGRGLTFWGGPGTGKTFLSVLMAKELVLARHDVFMATYEDFVSMFSAGWSDTERRDFFSGRVRSAGVLFLDDVGKGSSATKSKELGAKTLEATVRYRVQRALPTIMTMNMSPEDFEKRHSIYLISLLSESNRSVEVTGEDYRDRKMDIADAEQDAGVTRPVLQ